jgi:hypothetical protein
MWPDGSLKWTAHSVSSHIGYGENYTVKGVSRVDVPNQIIIDENSSRICISTAIGLQVKFSSSGSFVLEGFSLNGHIVCSKADIVACINKKEYSTVIKTTEIENASFSRAVVKKSQELWFLLTARSISPPT